MNARFWEWIASVNARLVFLWTGLICLVVLSSGILLGGHGEFPDDELLVLGKPYDQLEVDARDPAPRHPSPSDNEIAAEDPFVSDLLVSLLEREKQQKEENRRRAEIERMAKPAENAPPAPMGPPRQAQLLYRGIFTRPDGTVLALVENLTSGETLFFRENDELEGLRVGPISRAEVLLRGPHKQPIALSAGEMTHIELEP